MTATASTRPAPAIRWRSHCFHAAAAVGLVRDRLLNDQPEEREVSFDADTKMMATFHAQDGGFRIAVKGAPEAVLEVATQVATEDGAEALSDAARKDWEARVETLAAEGYRMLAFAERQSDNAEADPYEGLTLLGLVGLEDPPRDDVPDAIERCRRGRHPRHHGHRRPAGDGCRNRRTGRACRKTKGDRGP